MTVLFEIYQEFIVYGSVIVAIFFALLSIALHFKIFNQKTLRILSFIAIVLCTMMSIEYYPFQIFQSPISLLIPISLIVIAIDFFVESIASLASKTLFILNILYLAFGLGILTSSANTWGNISAVLGMFIVPNTLLMTIYLSFTIKNYKFLSISFLIAAMISLLLIDIVTNGFQYGMYDGDFVKQNRYSSLLICFVLIFTGIMFYKKQKGSLQEKL
ncbi:hypothetical protein [Kordia sp.]|uniref:hypothetical protein n=1 Tax=Kordia sp. TaxID=1965332 RepID=UPI003B5BA5DF